MDKKIAVHEYMTEDPVTVKAEDAVQKIAELMQPGAFRHLPVVSNDGKVVGMISDRDLRNVQTALDFLQHTFDEGDPHVLVQDVMSDHVETIAPQSALSEAAKKMNELKIGALAVIEDDSLKGIITYTDVLNAFIDLNS